MSESGNFEHILGGAFGKLEATVGPEAYQAQVELNQSAAAIQRKQAEMMESQRLCGIDLTATEVKVNEAKAFAWHSFAMFISAVVFLTIVGGLAFVIDMWIELF